MHNNRRLMQNTREASQHSVEFVPGRNSTCAGVRRQIAEILSRKVMALIRPGFAPERFVAYTCSTVKQLQADLSSLWAGFVRVLIDANRGAMRTDERESRRVRFVPTDPSGKRSPWVA